MVKFVDHLLPEIVRVALQLPVPRHQGSTDNIRLSSNLYFSETSSLIGIIVESLGPRGQFCVICSYNSFEFTFG